MVWTPPPEGYLDAFSVDGVPITHLNPDGAYIALARITLEDNGGQTAGFYQSNISKGYFAVDNQESVDVKHAPNDGTCEILRVSHTCFAAWVSYTIPTEGPTQVQQPPDGHFVAGEINNNQYTAARFVQSDETYDADAMLYGALGIYSDPQLPFSLAGYYEWQGTPTFSFEMEILVEL